MRDKNFNFITNLLDFERETILERRFGLGEHGSLEEEKERLRHIIQIDEIIKEFDRLWRSEIEK